MRIPSIAKWTVGVVCVAALVVAAGINAHQSGAGADARSKMIMIAPAAAGGGWDLVAREAQQALRTDGIVNNVQVVNVPGAGGTIGLSQLTRLAGDGTTMMVTGTVMLGGIARNHSEITLADTTPIARLAEDFDVFVVSADSPFQTFEDFLQAWQAHPEGMPIGGGSAGGVDHLIVGQLAQATGIDMSKIRYSAYAGGGELTINLLSTAHGTPNVGVSGFNDFRDMLADGKLRPLMVVAPERLEGLEAPTAAEAGYPTVDLVNWRGMVAPPHLTPEQQNELIGIVTEMTETEHWEAVVKRNRWKESFLTGDEFGKFLVDEQQRISTLVTELGLDQ